MAQGFYHAAAGTSPMDTPTAQGFHQQLVDLVAKKQDSLKHIKALNRWASCESVCILCVRACNFHEQACNFSHIWICKLFLISREMRTEQHFHGVIITPDKGERNQPDLHFLK